MMLRLATFLFLAWFAGAASGEIPNVTQGAPGTLLGGPIEQRQGRLTHVAQFGPYLITETEGPGSEAGDHVHSCIWDLSNLFSPTKVIPIGNIGG